MSFSGLWSDRSATLEGAVSAAGESTRVVGSGSARMIVLGHCLASDAELAEAMASASASGRLDPAAARWPGCYSLALVLPQELLLLTDPVGQFPWYAARTPEGHWFGSSPVELAGRVGAGIDHSQVAMSIACADVLDLSERRTEFAGVRRLPLGSLTAVNSVGISVKPCGALAVGRESNFEDAAQRLRSSLIRAVEARAEAGQTITGDFSGGIDSSALIFLALRTGAEVSGFTFHNSGGDPEDDLAWARQYAVQAPGLTHRLVRSTDKELPYQNLTAPREEPHPSPLAAGPLRARLRLAVEHGSTVHLVGEGGDVVLGAPPAYLADLARRGELTALWRHCVRWGRVRQCSPLALLRRAMAVVTTSRRQALRALAAAIVRAAPVEDRRPWQLDAIGYWEPPRARWLPRKARVDLADHVEAMAEEPEGDEGGFGAELGVADAVTLSQLRAQVMTERTVRAIGHELGVEVHAPYLDSEVVRACLALPAWRRADTAVAKPLLRAALAGLVPESVLTRPTKGSYARSAFLGVRRAAPALRRLLGESVAADHGLLDPVPVRAVLERAIQGLPTPWRALNQVFAVELWLREVSGKVGRP